MLTWSYIRKLCFSVVFFFFFGVGQVSVRRRNSRRFVYCAYIPAAAVLPADDDDTSRTLPSSRPCLVAYKSPTNWYAFIYNVSLNFSTKSRILLSTTKKNIKHPSASAGLLLLFFFFLGHLLCHHHPFEKSAGRRDSLISDCVPSGPAGSFSFLNFNSVTPIFIHFYLLLIFIRREDLRGRRWLWQVHVVQRLFPAVHSSFGPDGKMSLSRGSTRRRPFTPVAPLL